MNHDQVRDLTVVAAAAEDLPTLDEFLSVLYKSFSVPEACAWIAACHLEHVS